MAETDWPQLLNAIEACQRCALHQGIRKKVPGQGNLQAKLMLVGEGPGQEEDRQGLAFVGPAGQLLTRMLASIGLSRDDVYIANVVKCRPPGNRVPAPEEVACCLPFLRAQYALIRPRVMLVLGATALKALVNPGAGITSSRGKWVVRQGLWMLPTYHPAALLRDPAKKRESWDDLQLVRDKLAELEENPHA